MSNQCEKKAHSNHKVPKKNLINLFYQYEASFSHHKEWSQRKEVFVERIFLKFQ